MTNLSFCFVSHSYCWTCLLGPESSAFQVPLFKSSLFFQVQMQSLESMKMPASNFLFGCSLNLPKDCRMESDLALVRNFLYLQEVRDGNCKLLRFHSLAVYNWVREYQLQAFSAIYLKDQELLLLVICFQFADLLQVSAQLKILLAGCSFNYYQFEVGHLKIFLFGKISLCQAVHLGLKIDSDVAH